MRVTFHLWGEEGFAWARAKFPKADVLTWHSGPPAPMLGFCRRNQHTPAFWQLPPQLLTWYEHRILELENEWN